MLILIIQLLQFVLYPKGSLGASDVTTRGSRKCAWWSTRKGTLTYLHFFLLWCISLKIVRLSIHKMEKLVTRFGGTTFKEHQWHVAQSAQPPTINLCALCWRSYVGVLITALLCRRSFVARDFDGSPMLASWSTLLLLFPLFSYFVFVFLNFIDISSTTGFESVFWWRYRYYSKSVTCVKNSYKVSLNYLIHFYALNFK